MIVSAPTSRQKILIVYGTRPEAIKLAPVVHALRRRAEAFEVTLCATGQHREMLDQVHRLFDLRPDHELRLMRPNQKLNKLCARIFSAIDPIFEEVVPDWMIVQGDTSTAMASAVAAFHRGIRVGHVEAGLRTGDLRKPFPEEANRQIVDTVAAALFAPTDLARQSLVQAGVNPEKIFVTGNTVIDALHRVCQSLTVEPTHDEVLVTVHRRESFGAPLVSILEAIRELAERFASLRWILPVHPNPTVKTTVRRRLRGLANVELHEPFDYRELVRRLLRCRLVLTDSGGIQEEAPAFGKPVLVLREVTERPEGIQAGVARLVGSDRAKIVDEASRLLTDPQEYRRMAARRQLYGDGRAAERIAAILAGEPCEFFKESAGQPGQDPADPSADPFSMDACVMENA